MGLAAKAGGGLIFLTVLIGVALFVPAGSLHYLEAWIYLGLFSLCSLAITIHLLRTDRALLERRLVAGPTAEKRRAQRLIQAVAQTAFLALLVVPAFDRRYAWSRVPAAVVVLGDLSLVGGMLIVFLVFRENTFASATIGVAKDQRVIDSGPYARVRHPMYAGALLLIAGTPLALGSWWGMLAIVPMIAVIVWRLLDEEQLLAKDLPGYAQYRARVRWRLIPGVF